MNDYQRKLNIKVQFNTNIQNIHSVSNHTAPDGHVFTMNDQKGQDYVCRTLIMATGVSTPNIPQISGIDYTIGYESMSVDPENYEGKTVLILVRRQAILYR
ncbi:FAD-dependent oxidoreductase domain-containing protein 2 [Biomphalaria pfeifferi]|uniref:FAD-dependent oxidoreductase domain-containing protein 2 n=1 Tax=Biomphalaria pfeifferi TaxID=112525 RepID=A0AAD8BKN3_BIOPF|nr:FAD-dependent oxidoreductase domain-containing protein 2 [Biomphalaria pfeifferi]